MKNYTDYVVDIKQLKYNIGNIRNLCGARKICAIVKANSYGLGTMHICQNISDLIDYFAVATLQEALYIRQFNSNTKILLLGVVAISDIDICSKNNISISIGNYNHLREILKQSKKDINIHLQVNTGLNRYGFRSIVEFKKAIKLIENSSNLVLEGVYSHFATKQNDTNYINRQYYKFVQFKNCVKQNGVIFHIANSFATIYEDRLRLDMVRVGMLMYGGIDGKIGNKLILSIKSHIVDINVIKKGDSVGYDRTFIAPRKMIIGVIPVGYADGLDRRLSNKFYVLISGKKCRIIGNICMDVFMVDLSYIDAKIGDEVILLGSQMDEKISLKDYADVLNTSIYDVLLKFNYKRMNYIINK